MNRLDLEPTRLLMRPLRRLRDHSQTDVYIVSFPKAGRTWLRVMVGKAPVDSYELPEDLLLNTFVLTTRARILATRFTHDGSSIVEGRGPHDLLRSKRKYRNKKVLRSHAIFEILSFPAISRPQSGFADTKAASQTSFATNGTAFASSFRSTGVGTTTATFPTTSHSSDTRICTSTLQRSSGELSPSSAPTEFRTPCYTTLSPSPSSGA